mmetsp:Transcript_2490/g.8372  ORF Transcript_2490/g.8372 Transcript_2490/m.8372 type:complete len:225 (+) Transcript_2490:271-945(+)
MTLPASSRLCGATSCGASPMASVATRPLESAKGAITAKGAAEDRRPGAPPAPPESVPSAMSGTNAKRATAAKRSARAPGDLTTPADARPKKSKTLNSRKSSGTKSARKRSPSPPSSSAWPSARASAVSAGKGASVQAKTRNTAAAGTRISRARAPNAPRSPGAALAAGAWIDGSASTPMRLAWRPASSSGSSFVARDDARNTSCRSRMRKAKMLTTNKPAAATK